ncbi:hypothetical protein U1Q18_032897, partial [Sarracenia purpurea var. burkii]
INFRTIILHRGLADRSVAVTKECLKLLKDDWLVKCCNGDPIELLKYLDVEPYEISWGIGNGGSFKRRQWRTWTTCFIQAPSRRYYRKKLEESLREEEDRLQYALANGGGNLPSLGAIIYASWFAANAARATRRNGTWKARIQRERTPVARTGNSEFS